MKNLIKTTTLFINNALISHQIDTSQIYLTHYNDLKLINSALYFNKFYSILYLLSKSFIIFIQHFLCFEFPR